MYIFTETSVVLEGGGVFVVECSVARRWVSTCDKPIHRGLDTSIR